MIYLKKILAMIEDRETAEAVAGLKGALTESGVALKFVSSVEAVAAAECAADSQAITEKVAENRLNTECAVLWLTDSGSLAQRLFVMGEAVFGVSHERNREQSFQGLTYICEKPQELDAFYFDRVYRRFRGIPWEICETERCLLRETRVEDVEAFFVLYGEPSLTRYMEGLYPTVEAERRYIREYINNVYHLYGFGVWTVCLKETGEIIGRAGVSYRPGCEEPELGYVIGVPWQGQGIATEVCRAIICWAAEELEAASLQALVQPDNAVSRHICEKLGMRQAGEVMADRICYVKYEMNIG